MFPNGAWYEGTSEEIMKDDDISEDYDQGVYNFSNGDKYVGGFRDSKIYRYFN